MLYLIIVYLLGSLASVYATTNLVKNDRICTEDILTSLALDLIFSWASLLTTLLVFGLKDTLNINFVIDLGINKWLEKKIKGM